MKGSIAIMALIICILLGALAYCPRKQDTFTTVYKKGQEIVRLVHGRSDTITKTKTIHHYHAGTVKIKHDTIHHFSTSVDSIQLPGIELSIRDTFQGDSVRRIVNILRQDTTKTITRVDTLYKQRTDSVFITKSVRGSFFKGFAVGAGVGFAAGMLVR